jgi:hypothetical protein
MHIDASEILQVITLAVVGWILLEVISIGRAIERHEQKLKDLPCDGCKA